MSDAGAFGFGKFIPGFDFLSNLAQGTAGTGAVPPFTHWIAPTVSVEEIDKRIEELKAVQFWLEQNNKALSATVQALQVQRMTLSTLKTMNVNLGHLAQHFPFGAAAAAPDASSTPASAPASAPAWEASAASAGSSFASWPLPEQGSDQSASAGQAAPEAATPEEAPPAAQAAEQSTPGEAGTPAPGMATALQWWGALTQQFQQIAQQAMQDPVQQQAMLKATQMTSDFAKVAAQTAGDMVRQAMTRTAASGAAQPRKSPPPAAKAKSTAAASAKGGKTTAAKAAVKPAAKAVKKPAKPGTAAVPKAALADKKTPRAASSKATSAAKKAATSRSKSR